LHKVWQSGNCFGDRHLQCSLSDASAQQLGCLQRLLFNSPPTRFHVQEQIAHCGGLRLESPLIGADASSSRARQRLLSSIAQLGIGI
jgi:hypothetical protein